MTIGALAGLVHHGLDAVADQVDDDLLNLDAVGLDLAKVLGQDEAGADLLIGRPDEGEARGLAAPHR